MSDIQEAIPAAAEQASHPSRQLFHINDFEGPLDLILFLIRKNEINVYDIPVASITEQFLEYLSWAEGVGLDDLTEFYSMAATLLYIKSRMLLPVEMELDEEIEDPRTELVDKLIEYQRFKKLSELIERKEEEAEWAIERKRIQRPLPFADDGEFWDKIDVWDLLKSFSGLMSNMSSERIFDLYEEVSINEKIALMEELLQDKPAILFTDLLTRRHSLMDVVCAFLAILEAVKMRIISIYQHRLFGDIQIRSYAPPAQAAEDGNGPAIG